MQRDHRRYFEAAEGVVDSLAAAGGQSRNNCTDYESWRDRDYENCTYYISILSESNPAVVGLKLCGQSGRGA